MYKQEKVDINCLCTFVRFNRVRMERKVFEINVAEFIYNLQTNQSGRHIAVNSYSVDANMDNFNDVNSLCQPVPVLTICIVELGLQPFLLPAGVKLFCL